MKLALIGYGKMGKTIEKIAIERGHSISLIIDVANLHELTTENLIGIDVAIEFTQPESAIENLKTCFKAKVPVVCGTTGWLAHEKEMEAICLAAGTAFIHTTNFSIGVNLFFSLNKYLAGLMAGYPAYEPVISETHHTTKKDSPSGTAITLAEGLLENYPLKTQWTSQDTNSPTDLYIESIRQDPAPGTHSVTYRSVIDDIEIKHEAHTRDGFALGAVLAAEFLPGKCGIFNMQNVLGL